MSFNYVKTRETYPLPRTRAFAYCVSSIKAALYSYTLTNDRKVLCWYSATHHQCATLVLQTPGGDGDCASAVIETVLLNHCSVVGHSDYRAVTTTLKSLFWLRHLWIQEVEKVGCFAITRVALVFQAELCIYVALISSACQRHSSEFMLVVSPQAHQICFWGVEVDTWKGDLLKATQTRSNKGLDSGKMCLTQGTMLFFLPGFWVAKMWYIKQTKFNLKQWGWC